MTSLSNEVLTEKIRTIEREVQELKNSMRSVEEEIDDIQNGNAVMLHRLDNIISVISEIKATVSKDAGWRGFLIDAIKAAAQIAVLVGAGKWIF